MDRVRQGEEEIIPGIGTLMLAAVARSLGHGVRGALGSQPSVGTGVRDG